jgi:hypothetical protein
MVRGSRAGELRGIRERPDTADLPCDRAINAAKVAPNVGNTVSLPSESRPGLSANLLRHCTNWHVGSNAEPERHEIRRHSRGRARDWAHARGHELANDQILGSRQPMDQSDGRQCDKLRECQIGASGEVPKAHHHWRTDLDGSVQYLFGHGRRANR